MDRLNDIAVFVCVVEQGSFTRAAEHLGMSKAVISKYVHRLEARLGARVLNRSTRRLSLTEAGAILFERSAAALAEIARAELEVDHLQASPRGTLRLHAPMAFGLLHLAPAITEFTKRFPETRVDLTLDDRTVDMVEEAFDIALQTTVEPHSTLVARRLAYVRLAVYASRRYLAQAGEPRCPEDLGRHNCLVYTRGDDANEWQFSGADGRVITVPVQGNFRASTGLALRSSLQGGNGIAVMPAFLLHDLRTDCDIVTILKEYRVLPERALYAVYPQRKYLSPKVRAFVDFMLERIGSVPYWDVAWSSDW